MANIVEQLDGTSIKGVLISLGTAFLSFAYLESWLKLIALCVSIIAGVTSIIYHVKKIKKHEN
jgi:hypothetical protein